MASLHSYERFFSLSLDMMCVAGFNGYFKTVNPAWESCLGYSEREMLAEPFIQFVHPDDREATLAKISLLRTGKDIIAFENRFRGKDGSYRWFLWNATPFPAEGAIYAVARDITERRTAEEALFESEKRYRTLVEMSPEAIVVHTKGNIVYANSTAAKLFNAAHPTNLIGVSMLDLVPPDYRERVSERMHNTLDLGIKSETPITVRSKTIDGREMVIEAIGSLVPFQGERAVQIILRDISLQHQAESELRESEERYRALVDSSPEAIGIHVEYRWMYVNSAMVRLFRARSADDIIGKPIFYFGSQDPEDQRRMKNRIDSLLTESGATATVPVRAILPGGEVIHLEINAARIMYKGKPAAQIVIRDVTQHRLFEEELTESREQLRNLAAHLQSAREEERTHIAREIHDELGQFLTGLKMDVSFLREIAEEKTNDQARTELLQRIDATSSLLDATVQSVRKISSELRPAVLDNLGLLEAIEWQAEEFQKRMNISCECFFTVDDIRLNRECRTAIFRILQESLTNVVRHAQATRVTIGLSQEDNSYVLEIRDNGIGLHAEDLKKINSFGHLGIRERVHLFGGTVRIDSKPGKGTSVIVTIPIDENRSDTP